MEIHKDDREWIVRLFNWNKDCPKLYYPCNYHGCLMLRDDGVEDDACTKENCLARYKD